MAVTLEAVTILGMDWAERESLMAKFHSRWVRVKRAVQAEGLTYEERELKRRRGEVGWAHCVDVQGGWTESVSVRFEDGMLLSCLPEELEVSREGWGRRVSRRKKRPVQSCIAHTSFSSTLEVLLKEFAWKPKSDMEQLLWPEKTDGLQTWTSPRWIKQGDVLFFYHTQKAMTRLKSLRRQLEGEDYGPRVSRKRMEELASYVVEQEQIALRYAGTLFGCAEVAGPIVRFDDLGREKRHWRSDIYAPLNRPHVFERPIPIDLLSEAVMLSPGGAMTPLHGKHFAAVRELVGRYNELPEFLASAEPGGVDFRKIDRKNWMELGCAAAARFIDESQLRAYLLDYLLEEIKDPRTTVYQECRCASGSGSWGFADYFVRVGGKWWPVEAKLNVRAEVDLVRQVRKYLGVREFEPKRGRGAGRRVACAERGEVSGECLVVDAHGVYLIDRKGFRGCEIERPLLLIATLTKGRVKALRDLLLARGV